MLVTLESWAEHSIYGTVVIEDVHAMPKAGRGVVVQVSARSKARAWSAVFAQAHRPIEYVAPAEVEA
jgi:hypothetical protein